VHSREVLAQPVLPFFARDPPEVARDASSRFGQPVKLGGGRFLPNLDDSLKLILTGPVDLRALPAVLARSPIAPLLVPIELLTHVFGP
jgi:hypothetical protein